MRNIINDPHICHGKAHIEGTRIPVHIILDLLAAGETNENILNAYPALTGEDIASCIKYAAKLATGEVTFKSEAAWTCDFCQMQISFRLWLLDYEILIMMFMI